MPNSDRDIDIFEYCQYVMRAFEFHKLLTWIGFYLLLVVTMETITGLLQNRTEINCIEKWLELFHLVIILQNLMCINIVEFNFLVHALDKSI